MNQRIIKEVRLLFWPWCLIVITSLLPLLSEALYRFRGLFFVVATIGFFGGISFLAALSLGGEFQQRTIALLLGQPVARTRIWAEKQAVLLVMLAVAIPLFWFCWPVPSDLTGDVLGLIGAWLMMTVSSATLWTLVARSTLGGLVLGQVVQVILGAIVINVGVRLYGTDSSPEDIYAFGAAIFLGYSALMLWLGRRKLLRFQATGSFAGGDLLTAGPRILPIAIADTLRCRATSPTLNLVRKELRLLRPLWLITLLFLVCWACIAITFRLTPRTDEWNELRQVVPSIAIALYVCLSVILAGCLSLGEERAVGTQAWHLTLPVSSRLQWFIKLIFALGSGVVCSMVIPLVALATSQSLLGSPFDSDWKQGLPDLDRSAISVLLALFVSFPAFWCACVVSGTVRAASWVLPVMGALFLVGTAGSWLAQQFESTSADIVTMIISKYQLNPQSVIASTNQFMREAALWWLVCPTLFLGIIQSCRLFRAQPVEGVFPVIRRVLPLTLVAFLSALFLGTVIYSVRYQRESVLVAETEAAIHAAFQNLEIDASVLDPANPLQLSLDDLTKASPMSDATRQWLRNASFSLRAYPGSRGKTWHLQAGIHFADGSAFFLHPILLKSQGTN